MSAAVAQTLAHQLALAGMQGHCVPLDPGAAAADLATLTHDDVLVVFNLWRHFPETVRLVRAARATGARTTLFTDSEPASVVGDGDVVLHVVIEAVELSDSLTAMLALANALVIAVALDAPDRTLERVKAIDEVYDRLGVFAE